MLDVISNERLTWFDIVDVTEDDFYTLNKYNYDFHELDKKDCLSIEQCRPKIEQYDDYRFVIAHFPIEKKDNKGSVRLSMNELYFFWGENYLITIHSSEMSWLTNYFKQEKNGTIKKSPQSVDQLLYAILQNVVSQMRPIMSNIRYGIEKIDDNYGNERPEDVIKQISELRRNIIFLQSSLKPQKNIFAAFEQMKDQQEKNMDAYWGNIGDFLGKMMDMAEDDQELLEGLYSSIDTLLTFRTNKIMKILAMITVISLPLTTISGFYGMNVPLPFQNSINAIWGIISVMVIFCVIAVVLLIKINKN